MLQGLNLERERVEHISVSVVDRALLQFRNVGRVVSLKPNGILMIKPRARYYMNILDRNSGDVKILSVGVILFKKIIAAMLDEDFGDITDLADGHDFKIIKEMEGQWPKYDQSAPRPKSSPAGSKAEVASAMDSLHDIHSLVKLEDYEEYKKVVAALTGLPELSNPNSPDEDVSDGDYLSKLQS